MSLAYFPRRKKVSRWKHTRERNHDQTMRRQVFGPAPARLIRMHNSVYTGSNSGPGTGVSYLRLPASIHIPDAL